VQSGRGLGGWSAGLAPAWRWTDRIVHAVYIPALLAVAYGFLLFAGQGPKDATFSSLAGVTALFRSSPAIILACWTHYLVFDLFVGAWVARDARRLGVRHVFVVPSLVLTLLVGPLGLLSWLVIRVAARKRLSLVEA